MIRARAQVRNIESFIQASIAAHGDKYDYTHTVYNGASKPISIGCKQCGHQFTLSAAESHYGKLCGCRMCEIELSLERRGCKRKTCNTCGNRLKYSQAMNCKDCKADRLNKKRNRQCKKCGKAFYDHTGIKVVCSIECKLPPIKIVCCICGKTARKNSRIDRDRVCSRDCQSKLMSRKMRVDGRPTKKELAIAKSIEFAKLQEAKKQSTYWRWSKACGKQLSQLLVSELSDWQKRITSAASLLKAGRSISCKTKILGENNKRKTWESCIGKQVTTMKIIVKSVKEQEWSKRSQKAVSCMARRRRSRNARNNT